MKRIEQRNRDLGYQIARNEHPELFANHKQFYTPADVIRQIAWYYGEIFQSR